MSRKSKNRLKTEPVAPKLYLFVVADSTTNQRVIVEASIFCRLIKRGWAVAHTVENLVDRNTGVRTERRVAVLAGHLALRSATPLPDGNLCFRSLLDSTGAAIESSWNAVERAWTQRLRKQDFVPRTWQGCVAVYEMRQSAIEEEVRSWSEPDANEIRTGAYLSPEDAALAIAARQAAS